MSIQGGSAPVARRRILRFFGFGAAATVVGTAIASNRIFAKHFVDEGLHLSLPEMTYDPRLQMMVNPRTGKPIFEDASRINVASGYPTITPGCSDCPKKDDDGS